MIAAILAMWTAVAVLVAVGELTDTQQRWFINLTLIALIGTSAATSATLVYLAWRYLP